MLITAVELSNETYIFLPLPSQIMFCPGWLEPGATPPPLAARPHLVVRKEGETTSSTSVAP